jgi:hypothetical protein
MFRVTGVHRNGAARVLPETQAMNSRTKLTDVVVARATVPPGKSELVLWDAEVTGFGLRLRGGSKSYVVSYRPAGGGRGSPMKR